MNRIQMLPVIPASVVLSFNFPKMKVGQIVTNNGN